MVTRTIPIPTAPRGDLRHRLQASAARSQQQARRNAGHGAQRASAQGDSSTGTAPGSLQGLAPGGLGRPAGCPRARGKGPYLAAPDWFPGVVVGAEVERKFILLVVRPRFYGIPPRLMQMCVKPATEVPSSVPHLINTEGHILYILTGYSVEKYLLRTSSRFVNKRYGGWSFGLQLPSETSSLNSTNIKTMKVWYNQQGYHTAYLNQLNNFILWANLPPGTDWTQYGITLNSHPYGGALLDEDRIQESVRQCGVALCFLLGFSVVTASIATSVVKDRVSGGKRLQHISGLSYTTYWLANFLYDVVFYLVPVDLCTGVFAAFQLTAFTFRENLSAVALLLILFGFSTLP
ncbi:ATP-binding cassette sub-family A member 13-like [Acipenser ruthenus]|uniref:ATP-binding cassette sub-family A member 13-like n=1 Tax=Acipenser ruthenus TaxID=7906 RepID=UPI0027414D6E|nr:ATP-binding cassette sub-family A member 13-like [Acipenser ruthenus]